MLLAVPFSSSWLMGAAGVASVFGDALNVTCKNKYNMLVSQNTSKDCHTRLL